MVGQNVLLCQTPIVVRLFKELAHLPQLVRITSTGPYHVQGMQLLARDLHYQHYTNIFDLVIVYRPKKRQKCGVRPIKFLGRGGDTKNIVQVRTAAHISFRCTLGTSLTPPAFYCRCTSPTYIRWTINRRSRRFFYGCWRSTTKHEAARYRRYSNLRTMHGTISTIYCETRCHCVYLRCRSTVVCCAPNYDTYNANKIDGKLANAWAQPTSLRYRIGG